MLRPTLLVVFVAAPGCIPSPHCNRSLARWCEYDACLDFEHEAANARVEVKQDYPHPPDETRIYTCNGVHVIERWGHVSTVSFYDAATDELIGVYWSAPDEAGPVCRIPVTRSSRLHYGRVPPPCEPECLAFYACPGGMCAPEEIPQCE